MIRRLAWIVPALALGLGVAAASAQTSSFLVLFGNLGGSRPVATTEIPAQLTGELLISFHWDPATGCAGQGLCAYSGTVLVRPGLGSGIGVAAYHRHGQRTYQVALSLGGGSELTTAQVNRAGGGVCADAEQPFVSLPATIANGTVTLPLLQAGGSLLGTRCAGPLDGDFAGVGPQITMSLRDLLRGRGGIDLSGSRSFAAAGFAGTVDSTLKLTLGRPFRQSSGHVPPGFKTRLMREVDETLTITRASGQSSLAVNGAPGSCQFLDSCGLSGTVNASYDPTQASGALTVIGLASRPYGDFLAALGLSRRGNPHGLQILGTIGWTGGGTVTSKLEQGGPCTSQAPLSGGAIALEERGDRLGAQYTTAEPRTRCAGPALPQGTTLAQGVIPLRELAGRSFTLALSGGGPLTDDGYSVDQRTALTLSLRRGALRQTTLRYPG